MENQSFCMGKEFFMNKLCRFGSRTIVAIVHIADAFFEEIGDLHVGEFAFERNRYVEDQVCVGRTFYYAKS